MLRTLLFWLCLSGLATPALAQREYANWCFGYDTIPDPRYTGAFFTKYGHGAQVDFSGGSPQTRGLCRASNNSISDGQGNLLFYTNGDNIYDRRHQLMPGGAGLADATDAYCQTGFLNGPSLNNVLLPAPGQTSLYYVFSFRRDPTSTVSYIGNNLQLFYSLIDMRMGSGYGTVIQRDVVVSTTNNTMHLLAVRHRNNRDFWLVTRQLTERTFLAYLLTPNGLTATPVVSAITEATAYPIANYLSFRCSPDGRQVVDSGVREVIISPGHYRVEAACALYNFDNGSGSITSERVFHTTTEIETAASQPDLGKSNCGPHASIYTAACFSPSGKILYTLEYTVEANARASICQYDLTLPTPAAIGASRLVLVQQAASPYLLDVSGQTRFSDLQLAPDGTIWVGDLWHLNQLPPAPNALTNVQPKAVSIIRHPDVLGLGCQLDLQVYPLPGLTSPAQFPNVVANMLYPPTALEAEVSCTDSVRLWANSAQSGPPGRWDFGEPASGGANAAIGYYVAHRYAHGGPYTVTLTYANGRQLSRTIEVPAGAADLSDANVFTPNGDGVNDTFRGVLHGALTDSGRLRVFSRWGRLVYEAAGLAPAWDGAGAAAGHYFYQFDYLDCQGQTQSRRGWLELIR